MKIAIFSDCYLDLTGGIVTAINAEKQELERRGHTVYVFSSAYPKSAQQTAKFAKENIFPVPSCRFLLRGLTPLARRPKIIENWLEKTHPELKTFDIIYVHYEAGCSIAGLRFAKKHHIPAIQVMHGREDVGEESLISKGLRTFVAANLDWFHSWYLPHPVKIQGDNYLATTRARAFMWSLMVNHANSTDLILTPSEHFAKKLKHYGVSQKIIALPHGLPDALTAHPYQGRDASSPLEIIWHSRVSKEKRILPFLKALANLPENSYHLNVFGSGNDLKKAQKFAKKHRLNVTFHGAVPAKTVYHALEKADLDILVSYDYDTFGMTLIEAAAFGVPSLIVDPDLAEALPKNAYFLAENPSVAGITSELLKLLKSPEIIPKTRETLLKSRKNLQISRKIDKLEQIFTKISKNVL